MPIWLIIVLCVIGGFIVGLCAIPVYMMIQEMRGKGFNW